MHSPADGSASGPDRSRRWHWPRALAPSGSLASFGGAGLVLVSLVTMLAAPLIADRVGDRSRQDLAGKIEPLQVDLGQVHSDIASLGSEERAYAFTGDARFLQRYRAERAALDDDLARLDASALAAGFDAEASDVRSQASAWAAMADQVTAGESTGVSAELQARVVGDETAQLDRFTAASDALSATLSGEVQRLEAEIHRVNRRETLVIFLAGVLGAVAAGVLLGLTFSRQRLLQQAERERGRFVSMISSLRYSVYHSDRQGRVVYINPAAERLLGYAPMELVGRKLHQSIHHSRPDGTPYPEAECPFSKVLREAQAYRAEDMFFRKDGSAVPVEINVAPIVAGGRVVGAVGVFQDIAERIRQERMRDHFIAFASHELRSPLTVLYGFAHRLANRAARDPERFDEESREAIEMLRSETERMDDIIRLFLDLARIQTDRLTVEARPLDLCELVQEECQSLRLRHPEAVLEDSYPDGPVPVDSDANRLRQVLTNLLDNAVKYGGGRVSLELERDGSAALIVIRDRGPGIPPEDQPHIFEPFYRGSADAGVSRGMGIGLFLTREIVERLGGSVTFESRPGEGTEFRVLLPLRVESLIPEPA